MKTSYSRWLRACFSCTSRSNCIRFSIVFDWDDVFVISDLAKMRSSLRLPLHIMDKANLAWAGFKFFVFGFVRHSDKEYTADGDAYN
jgi:hypothetical protein